MQGRGGEGRRELKVGAPSHTSSGVGEGESSWAPVCIPPPLSPWPSSFWGPLSALSPTHPLFLSFLPSFRSGDPIPPSLPLPFKDAFLPAASYKRPFFSPPELP